MRTVRTVAEGNLSKLVWGLLAIVAIIAVMTWYPQFAQAYEVKNQGNLACNDVIKAARFGPEAAKDYNQSFVEGCRRAGVHVQKTTASEGINLGEYRFTPTHNKEERSWSCDVKVAYPVDVEIWTVGPILGLKPIHVIKKLHFTHDVSDTY